MTDKSKAEKKTEEEVIKIQKDLQDSLDRIAKRVERLSGRFVQDTVEFIWTTQGSKKLKSEPNVEIVQFTKVWREVWRGIWTRSIDTISEKTSCIVMYGHRGSIIGNHCHKQQQTIFVIEGEIKVFMPDGNEVKVKEDGSIKIDPNVVHSLFFLEESMIISKIRPRYFSPLDNDGPLTQLGKDEENDA